MIPLAKALQALEPDQLVDLHRHWMRNVRRPTAEPQELREELSLAMQDRERVQELHEELAESAQALIGYILQKPRAEMPDSHLNDWDDALLLPHHEVRAVAHMLTRRGFLFRTESRDWSSFGEACFSVPAELARVLSSLFYPTPESALEAFSLRTWLSVKSREDLVHSLRLIGEPVDLEADRMRLFAHLCEPAAIRRRIDALAIVGASELSYRLIRRQAGIGEARFLERSGLLSREATEPLGRALQEACLGTLLRVDLSDAGLGLGPGSIVIFPEVTIALLEAELDYEVLQEPPPAADVLSDLAALKRTIDHQPIRRTRSGGLYRSTEKKLAASVLSPGARPYGEEESLKRLFSFAEARGFLREDRDGKLRTDEAWSAFEAAGAIAGTEELIAWVRQDLRKARGELHAARLWRLALSALEDRGVGRWTQIRAFAGLILARYLKGLDAGALTDRYQRRYRIEAAPELVTPATLLTELVQLIAGGLAWTGAVEFAQSEEASEGEALAFRLTRIGAVALGMGQDPLAAEQEPARRGALVVTADFEVIVFPEIGTITLVQEVARFARRRKADYSVHFRIDADSIHHAVAQGLDADAILSLFAREGRHPTPSNVAVQIRAWAAEVEVLSVRRPYLLRAERPEAIDLALRVEEVRAVAGERLNPLTLELREDPASPRIAAALRAQGFFLR